MQQFQENPFNSSSLSVFLYRNRKALTYITLVAFIISTIIAYLITPKFKSTVIMFPAVTNSISKALLTENPQADQDILKFGEEEEAEQMLQILNSDEIRDRVVKKFNLLEHYKIDPDEKYKMTELYNEYEDNISFTRTEFMSVKIEVYDTDPNMAADISNYISALVDSTKNRMQKERAKEALKIVETEYLSLKKDIREIDDSLRWLRRMGINDYETQSEVYNEQYATALAKGNKEGARALEQKLSILSEHGGTYVRLREVIVLNLKRLDVIKAKYTEAKIDAESNLPHKFVVNRGYVAEKKSYPIRWLVILASTVTTFLLALLLLMVLDNVNKIR